jgi:hypothetical protein
MTHNLDDWWQTPLGDSGMELYDLIVESLKDLMNQMKKEKRLDKEKQDCFQKVLRVLNEEYKKLEN